MRRRVRDKLRCHYEDAVQEALERGASPGEAHRTALAELGSTSAIHHDLSETHLAERRYRFAAAVSLIFPLALTSAASVSGQQDLFNTTWTAALLLGVIMHALWMMMFTRAAQPNNPAFAG